MQHFPQVIIPFNSIDFQDQSFKISRPDIENRLRKSLELWGPLEPPLLLKRDTGSCIILFGHQRLKILSEMKNIECRAYITDSIDLDFYLPQALLKNERGQIGPMGKIRLMGILRERLSCPPDRLEKVALRALNIPRDFIHNQEMISVLKRIPANLSEYLDIRDISFRVIRELLQLTPGALNLIDHWVRETNPRVNFFRETIEYVHEIYIRDGSLESLSHINPGEIEDRKQREERLHQEVFRIRYPGYSAARQKTEAILDRLKNRGIEIDLPPYFEGRNIRLKLILDKSEEAESIRARLLEIDLKSVEELLRML